MPGEEIEENIGVLRAGAVLGMELHREVRLGPVFDPLVQPVVRVQEPAAQFFFFILSVRAGE